MVTHKKLWFKNKRYGWGWVPATWQGWACVLLFLLGIVLGSWLLLGNEPDTYGPVLLYVLWILLCSTVLVYISYKHGEKPGWRWGDDDEKE